MTKVLKVIYFGGVVCSQLTFDLWITIMSERIVASLNCRMCLSRRAFHSSHRGGDVSMRVTKIDDAITRVITAKNRGAETPMTFVFVVNVGKARVFLTAVSHVAHAISHTRIATCQKNEGENERERERDRKRVHVISYSPCWDCTRACSLGQGIFYRITD